ncbi:hypothetical protein M3Y94_00645000 [Aphelenchoides besseyi]|nr:hypothetical protein M3Y94_00645000 [Aphelenchoides besseyi]KAI6231066.1 hypothetical protein M3Y95_00342100 [Aphelenchoides besseyi]
MVLTLMTEDENSKVASTSNRVLNGNFAYLDEEVCKAKQEKKLLLEYKKAFLHCQRLASRIKGRIVCSSGSINPQLAKHLTADQERELTKILIELDEIIEKIEKNLKKEE